MRGKIKPRVIDAKNRPPNPFPLIYVMRRELSRRDTVCLFSRDFIRRFVRHLDNEATAGQPKLKRQQIDAGLRYPPEVGQRSLEATRNQVRHDVRFQLRVHSFVCVLHFAGTFKMSHGRSGPLALAPGSTLLPRAANLLEMMDSSATWCA
jgi:hypothetical protein